MGQTHSRNDSAEHDARQVWRFMPPRSPANSSKVGVHVFDIFVSFEFKQDRRSCERLDLDRLLSLDVPLRVAVPSQFGEQITLVTAPGALQACVQKWRTLFRKSDNTKILKVMVKWDIKFGVCWNKELMQYTLVHTDRHHTNIHTNITARTPHCDTHTPHHCDTCPVF